MSTFENREQMLDALLTEEVRARRRPGMTAGQLAERLPSEELRQLYWRRKIAEYAEQQGIDPDA